MGCEITARVAAHSASYLRRRRLGEGPKATSQALIETLKAEIQGSEADIDRWLAEVEAARASAPIVVLNTAAWVALERGDWARATRLARETVNRDHHDLLAQRLVDAAREQARDLVTETDRWLTGRTCTAPFNEMESRTNGQVHFCCSAWQPAPIGPLNATGDDGFWNSESAREIRRSVLEGDFSHCSRWHCPAIAGRRLPARDTLPDAPALRVDHGPTRVILSHDRSCNISCPSCRSELITLDHGATRRLDDLFQDKMLPLVRAARVIKVTGSGDPFGSRHFRTLIKRLTGEVPAERRIQLHTNALLANERAWGDLGLWGHVSSVWVSVDAVDPETYRVLRRGGEMADLLPNLRFLGRLRAIGAIDSFRLDFVVQQMNYDEMGDFTDLARQVGADAVYFLRLRNWGHFDAASFAAMDVCAPDHPEHGRLIDRLGDPRLRGPGVDLGSMTALAPTRAYA